MPVVEMRKLVLIGNSSERERLIKILHTEECAEIVAAQKTEGTHYADKQSALEVYGAKKAKLDFIFDFIKSCQIEAQALIKEKKINYTPVKKPFLAGKPSLTMEEFYETPKLEEGVFDACDRLTRLSESLLKNKSDEIKLKNTINQLQPYKEVDAKLESFKDTKDVSILLGTVPSSRKAVAEKAEELGACMLFYDAGVVSTVVCIVLKEKYEETAKILSDAEFSACTLNYTGVPRDVIAESEKLLAENTAMREKLIEQSISFEYVLDDCKRLYDYYLVEERKLECEANTSCTETSYILEAWVPVDKTEKLDKALSESPLALMYEIREPLEGEKPPTYVEDSAVVEPYQSVTNMFSAPAYGEINPNPFVAFFFFHVPLLSLARVVKRGKIDFPFICAKSRVTVVERRFHGGVGRLPTVAPVVRTRNHHLSERAYMRVALPRPGGKHKSFAYVYYAGPCVEIEFAVVRLTDKTAVFYRNLHFSFPYFKFTVILYKRFTRLSTEK